MLDLEHFLPYRLSVLSNRLSRHIAAFYEDKHGIGITEWRVIAVLARHPGLSARDVAERTAMDKVAVSRAVSALLDAGRLLRKTDGDDRRRSVLSLSRAGQRIYDDVAPKAIAYERQLLSALSPDEQKALERMLDRIATMDDIATP